MTTVIEYLRDFNIVTVAIRLLLACLLGGLIGLERGRQRRAAGLRTHILVCIGAALTAMVGFFARDAFGITNADPLRVSAQVISGIGFLGAGMIIIKNNDIITGLTTAAGVWTTSIIGIALGYGFYSGAIIGSVLFLVSIIVFTKFEKRRKSTEVIYVEIDDMHKANETIDQIKKMFDIKITYFVIPPKSKLGGNLGVMITVPERIEFDINKLCEIEHVAYSCEE